MKEDSPQGPTRPEDLPRGLAIWRATEAPKIKAFESLLIQRAEQLRAGTIDEAMFLQLLTEDKEPVKILTRSRNVENRKEEIIEVKRTGEGKIQVGTLQGRRSPAITVTIGLSEDGHLLAEDISANWHDLDAIVTGVEEDYIDFFDSEEAKADAGKELIGHLMNVAPFVDRSQTKGVAS